jgi:hypothetical protein
MHTPACGNTFASTKKNNMNHKMKNILKWTPASITATMISLSAMFKLTHAAPLAEHYTQLGIVQYMPILGMMELLLVILFIYPRTLKIGLLMCTAYYGGAMATEFSHGTTMLPALILLVLVWVSAYARSSDLFLLKKSTVPSLKMN